MSKKPAPSQKAAFISAARKAEVDEDEGRWEQRLKAVAKPPAKQKKKS